MDIIEKYDKPFKYASILMHLILAYQYLSLWLYPEFTDAHKILSMSVLMSFEFVMVHSGVFMAVMPKKITLFFLIPIYGLFAWAFTASLGNMSIVYIYLVVVFNRMRFAFSDVSPQMISKVFTMSVVAVAIYFCLFFLILFSNGVFGELGLTEDFLNSISYFENLNAEGEFIEKPHIAISFGFFYYCLLVLFEVFLSRNKTATQPNQKS